MQEHAYPASNEPLILSRTMVGILDDDVIEVQILYRLYHAGILIKVLDLDKVVQRAAAFDPGRCAAHAPHASRVPVKCAGSENPRRANSSKLQSRVGFQACASNPAVTLANAAFASCSSTLSRSTSSRPLT